MQDMVAALVFFLCGGCMVLYGLAMAFSRTPSESIDRAGKGVMLALGSGCSGLILCGVEVYRAATRDVHDFSLLGWGLLAVGALAMASFALARSARGMVERDFPEAGSKEDRLAWLAAARAGELSSLSDRVSAGAAPFDARSEDGRNALMLAAMNGRDDCVKFFAVLGSPRLSETDKEGLDAAMLAAKEGADKCHWILARAGASVLSVDKMGRSAADHAKSSGSKACVDLLAGLPSRNEKGT